MLREVTLARYAWDILKPLEVNADTINVERHLPTQFQLAAPKSEVLFSSSAFVGPRSGDSEQSRCNIHGSSSGDRSRSLSHSLLTTGPQSPGFRQRIDTPRTEFSSENLTLSDGATFGDTQKHFDYLNAGEHPYSPNSVGIRQVQSHPQIERTMSKVVIDQIPVSKSSRNISVTSQAPDKGKTGWRSKLSRSRKESYRPSADTSSLSSTTLESQKLEEISLKSLTTASKSGSRGKSGKNMNVSLSQNSTHAIFWTQLSIHILDVGTSPPTIIRAISTESTCVLAAITRVHLAYIIGTRDQKLTVRTHTYRDT